MPSVGQYTAHINSPACKLTKTHLYDSLDSPQYRCQYWGTSEDSGGDSGLELSLASAADCRDNQVWRFVTFLLPRNRAPADLLCNVLRDIAAASAIPDQEYFSNHHLNYQMLSRLILMFMYWILFSLQWTVRSLKSQSALNQRLKFSLISSIHG